jgi:hypothetical protein
MSTRTVATAAELVVLYPACLCYRSFKAAHPDSFLK